LKANFLHKISRIVWVHQKPTTHAFMLKSWSNADLANNLVHEKVTEYQELSHKTFSPSM